MRIIADAGLVGFPNAGKSTLLAALSQARPKIAPYPFTTLHPQIGIIEYPDYGRLTMCDVPGLVAGFHRNVGLGHKFLRHVERCKLLVLLLDMAGTDGREPTDDYKQLLEELGLYDPALLKKPRLVLANKMDEPAAEANLKVFKRKIRRVEILPISAAFDLGLGNSRTSFEKPLLLDQQRDLPSFFPAILIMLKAGIVGLPNVGKSTLFNALTRTRKALAANYPFCTIDPNLGIVTVPDDRSKPLAHISKTTILIPAAIEFVDIAGLVKGSSQGEGLGNKFLSHIREVDAIVQVVRCFEDSDIHHVAGTIDPIRDIETITTEFVLTDLEAVRSRLEKGAKDVKRGDKAAIEEASVLQQLLTHLDAGRPAITLNLTPEEKALSKGFYLLSDKPTILPPTLKRLTWPMPTPIHSFSRSRNTRANTTDAKPS